MRGVRERASDEMGFWRCSVVRGREQGIRNDVHKGEGGKPAREEA